MAQTQAGLRQAGKQMRPALIVDSVALTGFAHCLRRLLLGLSSEGCQPALVCPPQYDAAYLGGPSIELIRYPALRIPLLYRQNRLLLTEKMAAFKPTVLHGFEAGRARLTRRLAVELGVPYVMTFRSFRPGLFKPLVSASHCAALIASSQPVARRLKKRYRFMADSILQVNIGTFVADQCACFADRSRLTSIVTVQPIHRIADFEPLLNALRHLAIDGFDFMLVIIGKGRADRALFRRISQLGLNQTITLVPTVHPLRSALAGADIFLQLGPMDPAGAQLLDAVSVGLAVASCRQGAEQILVDNESAVFFDPRDELSTYSALHRLLDEPDFARRLALAAQEHLRRNYSVSRMVEELMQTYLTAQQWYKRSTQPQTDPQSPHEKP